MAAATLFEENIDLVQSVVRFISRRRHLSEEDRDEFQSYVNLKLVENDYRILRQFEGRSSLRTYLTVVVQRLFLDHLHAKWGKWRPSASATRLGPVGMRLEELMSRDGLSFDEAAETLLTNHRVGLSRDELYRIADKLPPRVRRGRPVPVDPAIMASTEDAAEGNVRQSEVRAMVQSAEAAFEKALSELEHEDRVILKMRFRDGLSIPQIASALDLESKPLYRRIDKDLGFLKSYLEEKGLGFQQLQELIDASDFSFRESLGSL